VTKSRHAALATASHARLGIPEYVPGKFGFFEDFLAEVYDLRGAFPLMTPSRLFDEAKMSAFGTRRA
jgi:hypothetical protein